MLSVEAFHRLEVETLRNQITGLQEEPRYAGTHFGHLG
jgi:hypothetical protein